MKHILLSCLLLLCGGYTLKAQENTKTANEVINTLKERITLQGYAQVGYTYDDQNGGSNTFDIKRVIFMVSGQITDKWLCYFMYSFANTGKILEAYTEYKFLPEIKVRLGQFKTMYTFENPISPCYVELINCYAQSVNYLAGIDGSDPLYGSNSGRDLGLMVYGDLFDKLISYNLAVMNGQGINKKDLNNQKDIVGRLIFHPLKWLSAGGTITTTPVDIRTEYLAGKDGNVKSEGYYCTASVHVLPKLDVIASYDYLNKNKTAADKQTNYVAGLQYWFYPKCRVQAQYTYCDRHKGESSNLIQAQIQVRF